MKFGGFSINFVGDFQLPPVGDEGLYEEDDSEAFMLFKSIKDIILLEDNQRQA